MADSGRGMQFDCGVAGDQKKHAFPAATDLATYAEDIANTGSPSDFVSLTSYEHHRNPHEPEQHEEKIKTGVIQRICGPAR